jgi:hypothetical protein
MEKQTIRLHLAMYPSESKLMEDNMEKLKALSMGKRDLIVFGQKLISMLLATEDGNKILSNMIMGKEVLAGFKLIRETDNDAKPK